MSNETRIQGSQNIVIQDVTDSTITINVDGQLCEVERKLDALMALLREQQAHRLQTADKIYNIGAITQANFEIIVGQSALNLSLPSDLAHNLIAGDDRWVQSLRQELLKQPGVSVGNKPPAVFQHYGWLIETFLQKMGTPAGRERTRRRLAFMAEAARDHPPRQNRALVTTSGRKRNKVAGSSPATNNISVLVKDFITHIHRFLDQKDR